MVLHIHIFGVDLQRLEGLSAVVEGESLLLSYEGVIFAAEVPEGTENSPMLLLPEALAALRDGLLTESVRSGKRVYATYSRFWEEEETLFRFAFDRESGLAQSLSVIREGKEIASAEFIRYT